jgi:hypothetical protein
MNRFVILAALSLLAGAGPALSQTSHGDVAPMEQMDLGGPELAPPPKKEGPSPFVEDTTYGAQLRSMYFFRDKFDSSISEAWAIGGSAWVRTGYLGERVRFGAVAYTSQPLYAPSDRDGTLMLAPGQEGYTVLGQAYAEIKITERIFGAIGRKLYDTPYLGPFDVRMTPKTFEGVTVYGKAGSKDGGKDGAPEWRFGGGYITKIKELNSDEFVYVSRDAGASVDRGVYLAGANYARSNFSLGAIEYHSEDIINIFYTEAKVALPSSGDAKLSFAAQFTDQRSTGDDLLTGSSFSTNQWGIRADLGLGAATFTLGYTDTGSGADIQNPWSGHPGYTSVQVQNFFRANENALLLKAAYQFSTPGLTAYALVVRGDGVQAPRFNETEYDFDLQWKPREGAWKNSSWRVRYAHIDQRGGGEPTIDDFRIIFNYDF